LAQWNQRIKIGVISIFSSNICKTQNASANLVKLIWLENVALLVCVLHIFEENMDITPILIL
jgi:hypothetical protein